MHGGRHIFFRAVQEKNPVILAQLLITFYGWFLQSFFLRLESLLYILSDLFTKVYEQVQYPALTLFYRLSSQGTCYHRNWVKLQQDRLFVVHVVCTRTIKIRFLKVHVFHLYMASIICCSLNFPFGLKFFKPVLFFSFVKYSLP